MTTKKGIFISHIHEEAKLGGAVKEWVSDAFSGSGVNAFLSSDSEDLPAGRKWLDVIEKQIDEAGVMISLISPTSLARPWVNIELGAAWTKRVPIIPLCHSKQTIASLPRPFGDFNGVDLTRADAAQRLMGGVADALELRHPKGLNWSECLKQMQDAAAQSKVAPGDIEQPKATSELPEEQILILRTLAVAENDGIKEAGEEDVIRVSALVPAVFKYHANELSDAKLIYIGYDMNGAYYRLQPKGSGWLIKNKLMPK